MRDICWIDYETGGTDEGIFSPLSFAMIHTRGPKILAEWAVQIRDERMVVHPQALAVNKIDLRTPGVDLKTFREEYRAKINEWFYGGTNERGYSNVKPHKDNMPLIGGMNIAQFDRRWHHKALGTNWDGIYFHGIDLMWVVNALIELGIMRREPNIKLHSVVKQLRIPQKYGITEESLHDSLIDVKATFYCWLEIQSLLRSIFKDNWESVVSRFLEGPPIQSVREEAASNAH